MKYLTKYSRQIIVYLDPQINKHSSQILSYAMCTGQGKLNCWLCYWQNASQTDVYFLQQTLFILS